jgi:hypothetical protein
MVIPGDLPLFLIRGIEFTTLILQCRDDGLLVTGTLSPDVTGVYTRNANYGNYPLFIKKGSPAYFVYYNISAASYVIAATLTDGALTDFWVPAVPITEASGIYLPQGANTGTATATDNPVDLTGITTEAVVRRTNKTEVLLDLNPSITNAAGGEITIPAIPSATTALIEFTGDFNWDLVLVDNASGERFGPYVKGVFSISDNITQS